MSYIAAGAAVVGAGVSIYKGIKQKNDAKKLQNENPRPSEALPEEELANQRMAQNMSLEGLPSAQYEQARKNIQRQQAAAVGSAQDRRSGVANIGAIQQGTNDAYGNLDAANAGARRQNQLALMGVNDKVAVYRDKLFDWNQRQRYIQNENYAMSLLGAGNANIYGGIDKAASGLLNAYGNGAFGSAGSGGGARDASSSNPNMVGLANTGGNTGSPAASYGMLNPYGYSNGALIGG